LNGYVARRIRLDSAAAGAARTHCIVVAWPPNDQNSDGQPVQVATHVDDGWLRGIENTLERVPWAQATVVRRIVIDNRPKEHGIAPFEHPGSDDARDGHTIWLHERMFEEPNHWARGNYGAYWSYHVDVDGEVLDDKPPTHALFSPVLLHELGHLVSYNVLNGRAGDPTVPACAVTCADRGGCKELPDEEREAGCISPYCVPFQFDKTSTENWAEQYRFFYQGSRTRGILAGAKSGCLGVLVAHDGRRAERSAPWDRGLPDIKTFRKSLWDSCGGRACKAW
jgi:hypothetical protein